MSEKDMKETYEGAGVSPQDQADNPVDRILRQERMPHIWCPGCGIGTTVNCFARALEKLNIDLDNLAVVSGIGCTGRVAGYLKVDSFHTTHGRAIPFATGLKLANPKMKVVVYSGDGDLTAIGGNHLIHAARRNLDITVILVNNFTYGMTGGQYAPTTPFGSIQTTMPYGMYEHQFNIPKLVAAAGAVYVARWTVYQVAHLTRAMTEAIAKKGFSLVEVMSPCPTLYLRRNRLGEGIDEVKRFKEWAVRKDGADVNDVGISRDKPLIIGKFVDIERDEYIDLMNRQLSKKLGDRYTLYGVENGEV